MNDVILNSLYILIFCILILFIYGRHKKIKFVKANSKMFSNLLVLNSKYVFKKLKTNYSFKDRHSNKQKFDRDTPSKYMSRDIYDRLNFYDNLIANSNDNYNKYQEYLNNYDNIEDLIGNTSLINYNNFSAEKFKKIEHRLYKKHKLEQPPINFFINYVITYTSPQGRNSYSNQKQFSKNFIEKQLQNIHNEIKQKNTRQYIIKQERSKMTDNLRYNILKRDNFKCQICGSTQSDGVKLHVDHIVPVSKGGLTEESNLMVLCDRCNMGKSNKT